MKKINEFKRTRNQGLSKQTELHPDFKLRELVDNIAKNTSNAYSYNLFYDEETWKQIIHLLISMEFSPEAIEAILNSKYMRWIADDVRGNRDLRNPNFNPSLITFDEAKELIEEWQEDIMDFAMEEVGPGAYKEYDYLFEEAMGGISAPNTTLGNTPGMGNAMPAGDSGVGSGDVWGGNGEKKKTKKKINRKKKKEISEEDINPHDKIGVMMAKKMKVPVNFKKSGQGVKQKKLNKSKKKKSVVKESLGFNKLLSFDEWKNKL